MNRFTLKIKTLVFLTTLLLLFIQAVISGLIYKLFEYSNLYVILLVDLIISLIPFIFLAVVMNYYSVVKKKKKPLDKKTLDETLQEAGKMALILFTMIISYIIYIVFSEEINGALFAIEHTVMKIFANNFEELLLIWNLSSQVDVLALFLAIPIIIFSIKYEDRNEKKKAIITSLVIFFAVILGFFLEAVPIGKDFKDYYHLKDASIFHRHCKLEKFIIYSSYKGGVKYYIKCRDLEKIKFKTPIFIGVICNLPEGLKCEERYLIGKDIILIKSLHSEYSYGIRLDE